MSIASRLSTAVIGLALAAALLYLAVPRGMAAFKMFPENENLAALKRVPPADLSPRQLEDIAASRLAALHWVEDGQVYTDLALVRLVAATKSRNEDGKLTSEQARLISAPLERALALGPINPHAWTQLAYVRLLSEAPVEQVVEPLVMSLYTGPYEPRLVYPRLRLLLSVWSGLNKDEQNLVYQQVRFAWDVSRDKLVEMAAPMELHSVNMIRIALARTPKYLLSFEKRLRGAKRRAREAQDAQ